MSKSMQTTLLALSGVLAFLFFGNFIVHLLFYIMDGTVGKFISPVWMGLNGAMVVMGGVFVLVMRRESRPSH